MHRDDETKMHQGKACFSFLSSKCNFIFHIFTKNDDDHFGMFVLRIAITFFFTSKLLIYTHYLFYSFKSLSRACCTMLCNFVLRVIAGLILLAVFISTLTIIMLLTIFYVSYSFGKNKFFSSTPKFKIDECQNIFTTFNVVDRGQVSKKLKCQLI